MKAKSFFAGMAAGILAAAVIVASGYLGMRHAERSGEGVLDDPAHVQKIETLEQLIDEYYLNEKDEEQLAEGLYRGLIYGLGDPYSRYYTSEEYSQENDSSQGSYEGIGVVMQKNQDGSILVVECYENAPGEKAGLLAGDMILSVDGQETTGMELSEIVNLIKEEGKTHTVLTVRRPETEEIKEIDVPITSVELPSVYSEMLDETTGYIRLTEFKGVTYRQYMDAFTGLERQGMEKLVIDLRNNPGGYVDTVCDILREILPEGVIVYTEDKNGKREEEYCEGNHPIRIPLVVLVNENSASSSEIFAGAVQDYGAGLIIGTETYGKAVVQSIRSFPDGSAVKLTVSKYFTPLGHDINEVGIEPDVKVELDEGATYSPSMSREEDVQLQAAIRELYSIKSLQ